MKKFTSIAFMLWILMAASVLAQGFNYQTVLRNSSGAVEVSTAVLLKFSVLQGGPSGALVYAESHDVTTNTFGIISVVVGEGAVISGDFASIDWSNGPYYLNVDIDGEDMGTSQLNSVPYANYASMAETALTADVATTAGSAGTANNADHATTADNATNATNADHATTADNATNATNADHADSADNATTATSATSATTATTANTAKDLDISGATAGDMLYYNGTNWVRLAKGATGQVLTIESGVPAWKNASSSSDGPQLGDTYDGGTIVEIYPDGDVLLVYNTQIVEIDGANVNPAFDYATAQTLVPSGWSIPTYKQFVSLEANSTLLPVEVWPILGDLLFWTSTEVIEGGDHFQYYNSFFTSSGDATACRLIPVKKVPYL